MSSEKPRLARLTAIVTQLQSKRLVTAREIAEKYNISIRTVYRDIRTLEQSGIPVVTEEGRGYSIMEGYHLSPVMFTEEEANALITAEQIITKNKDTSFTKQYVNAINKIRAVLRFSEKDKVEFLSKRLEIRATFEQEKTSDYLMQLQKAITNYIVVKLNYHSLQHETTERHIEPFALIQTQNNWVLIAFCRLRNDFRAFRLDCMQQIRLTAEQFEPHDMTLKEYYERYFPSK